MEKRKAISQTLRFEVFKRDLFTCQYCGKRAPDVVLEVDHIKPVSKGGSNAIENLVSACKECNRGKGARKLSDLSEVEKSRQQLEELQERKNMVDLICQWKEEFEDLSNYMVDKVEDRFFELSEIEGRRFTGNFRNRVARAIESVGFKIVLEAVDIAVNQYVEVGNDNTIGEGTSKLLGIARNLHRYSLNPIEKDKSFTYNKAKKKFRGYPRSSEFFNHEVFDLINEENYVEVIRALDMSNDWEEFLEELTGLHETLQYFSGLSNAKKEGVNDGK
jgi:hypothetical protein